MIKVMEAIVAEQREFFEKGAIALRPLTLQQVASPSACTNPPCPG